MTNDRALEAIARVLAYKDDASISPINPTAWVEKAWPSYLADAKDIATAYLAALPGQEEVTTLIEKIRRDGDGQFGASMIDVEKLIALVSRLNARIAEQEWQSIETAPRDGSEVLLLTSDGAVQARFCPGEWHDYQEGREYDGPVWCCCDDRWTFEIEEHDGEFWDNGVTHWMPLPSPPNRQKSKG